MKQAFVFKFLVIFDKVMRVYFQKIAKNLSKIFFLVPFQIVLFKGYLHYKTILCDQVALDVELMNFFIWRKNNFCYQDIEIFVIL